MEAAGDHFLDSGQEGGVKGEGGRGGKEAGGEERGGGGKGGGGGGLNQERNEFKRKGKQSPTWCRK